MGGMVLETNMTEILLRIEEQNKIAKEEVIIAFLFIAKLFGKYYSIRFASFGYSKFDFNSFVGWPISSTNESNICCEKYEHSSTDKRYKVA